MKAVINSGPLIALSKLNLLHLLKTMFQKIYIPESVYNEVVIEGLRKGKQDAKVTKTFIEEEKDFVYIEEAKHTFKSQRIELDLGERDTIELACKLKTDFALIDEENTRKEARNVGLKVKGTLGILVMAHRKGVLSYKELRYFFQQVKARRDIWISAKLCDEVLKELQQKNII